METSDNEIRLDDDNPTLWWKIKFGVAVALLMLGAYLSIKIPLVIQQRALAEWDEFKITNNCKLIEHVDPTFSSGAGIGLGGGLVVGGFGTPEQNKWMCDGGVTYVK